MALALGAGIQAFRQWPPSGPVSVWPAVVIFLAGLLAAFFAGRAFRRPGGNATAVAVASAEASGNILNVQVFAPGQHKGERDFGLVASAPDPARVEWLDYGQPELTADAGADELVDMGVDEREFAARETL